MMDREQLIDQASLQHDRLAWEANLLRHISTLFPVPRAEARPTRLD
jgi:hypothetical protein